MTVDTTFYRQPRLQGWSGKLYRQLAGIGLGFIADVGQVCDQRLSLIRRMVRSYDMAKS